MRLGTEQTGRVGEHRGGIGLCKAGTRQRLEEDLRVLARHVGICLALCGRVAEIAEAIDDLLRRSSADAELEAAAGDQIGRSGVLDHVERVLVAHVDDGGADLDALRASADRCQKREGRRELLSEVVYAEVGAVGAEVLDRLGQLDRLDQRVRRRPDLRVGRCGPVAEREEADLLHDLSLRCRRHGPVRRRTGRLPRRRPVLDGDCGQEPGTSTLSMTWITPFDASTSGMRILAPSMYGEPFLTEGVRKSWLSVRIRVEARTVPLNRSPGATWWSRTTRRRSLSIWSTPSTPSALYRSANAASVGANTVN